MEDRGAIESFLIWLLYEKEYTINEWYYKETVRIPRGNVIDRLTKEYEEYCDKLS